VQKISYSHFRRSSSTSTS